MNWQPFDITSLTLYQLSHCAPLIVTSDPLIDTMDYNQAYCTKPEGRILWCAKEKYYDFTHITHIGLR